MNILKSLVIATLLTLGSAAFAQDGLWGGKWDDTWAVFIKLEAGTNANEKVITYRWTENPGHPMETMRLTGTNMGKYYETKFLLMSFEQNTGMLYGKFAIPRMANLVKITNEPPSLEGLSLSKYGWKQGAIPAAEAKKKILGEAAPPSSK